MILLIPRYAVFLSGTPYWTAPEIVRGDAYDHRADVYSFSIILWELITLAEPYKGMDPIETAYAVADKGDYKCHLPLS